jgi:hypothetical protein
VVVLRPAHAVAAGRRLAVHEAQVQVDVVAAGRLPLHELSLSLGSE